MVYLIIKPFLVCKKESTGRISGKRAYVKPEKETRGYAIEKVEPSKVMPAGKPHDLKAVYGSYPESDVGKSVISEWQKISPADRQKIMEGFDAKIGQAKDALKVNPEDKKARSLLKISEKMKNLAASDFNISAPDKGNAPEVIE